MLLHRQLLAIAIVALFFTNLAVYGYIERWMPPPVVFVAALLVASVPLWLADGALGNVVKSRLVQWTAVFLVLTTAWVAAQGAPEDMAELLSSRVTTSAFTIIAVLVLSDSRAHRTARLALCGAVIFGGAMNFYEVMYPMTFSTTFGRSAGWYMNPNTAAGTLTFGVILGVGALPERFRAAFVAFGMVIVGLTLSRGAVAGWILVLPALAVGRSVRLLGVAKSGLVVLVVGLGILWAMGTLPQVVSALELSSDQRSRLMISGGTEGDRMATNERVDAATRALEMFIESPIVGKGIGATEATAHNMYLQLAAEQGLIGFLLFPLLVAAAVRGGTRTDRGMTYAMGGFLVWWGFFSHTLYDEFQTLLALAVMNGIAQHPPDPEPEPAIEDVDPGPMRVDAVVLTR